MIGQRGKAKALDADDSAAIALKGLGFLASDMTRLGRFLTLTGVGPAELRAQAATPAMQIAVLDHLLNDESLLLVFAAETGLAPEIAASARRVLAGPGVD